MPSRGKRPRVPVHVTVDPDVVDAVLARIGPGKDFHSMSHAVQTALVRITDVSPATKARKSRQGKN